MTEEERYYDDVIAPALIKLRDDCVAHGIHLLAVCEWEPGETGRTLGTTERHQGMAFMMANVAAKSGGNVDAFWMWVQRYGRKNGHGSIFLAEQGIWPGGES